jgi:hypothetical protein
MLEPAEVVVEGGDFERFVASCTAKDRKRSLVHRPGLVEAPLVLVEHAEVVQECGEVDIGGPEPAFRDRQGTPEEALGLRMVSLRPRHLREATHETRDQPRERTAGVEEPCPALERGSPGSRPARKPTRGHRALPPLLR